MNALAVLLKPESEAIEDLFQRVDCPLKEAVDSSANKTYILSDHNREGDSYRSPWSNAYYPPIKSTFKPSRELRALEEQANELFDSYCQMYYGKDAVSSVYLWNNGGGVNEGFAGCFLIKKDIDEVVNSIPESRSQCGYWNSIHVVDVNILSGGKAKYELSTTVLLSIDLVCNAKDASCGTTKVSIGGSLTKQVENIHSCPSDMSHIANIGTMIENLEIELRSNMDSLYIQKTREVIDGIRCDSRSQKKHGLMATMMGSGNGDQQNEMQAALMARFKQKS
jgi:capping protein beta